MNSNRRLDYETNKRLRLTVTASANNVHGYTTVWVNLRDVNDNQPRFTQQRYVSSVWEGGCSSAFQMESLCVRTLCGSEHWTMSD